MIEIGVRSDPDLKAAASPRPAHDLDQHLRQSPVERLRGCAAVPDSAQNTDRGHGAQIDTPRQKL
jgi:hypothetical protein